MDICPYVLALMQDWVSLMSGVASVVLSILFFVILKKRQSRRWFGIAALVCFFLASARIWTNEHRKYLSAVENNSPKFQITAKDGLLNIYDNGKLTLVALNAELVNSGAPSVAINWKAHYKSPTFDGDVYITTIDKDGLKMIYPPPLPPLTIEKEDTLNYKTTNVLQRGAYASGKLVVGIPGDRSHEINRDSSITITVQDYLGKTYSYLWVGNQIAIKP
jgi:hypothetical protein